MPSNMEKVDIASLEKLIADIDYFNESMDDILLVMGRYVDNIQDVWDDDQYKEFRNYMEDLIKSLKKDLEIMVETQSALEKHHKIVTT